MSVLFATVAVVCTMSTCNDYVIDTSTDKLDGHVNTVQHNEEYQSVWEDEAKLNNWLNKYQIGETVFEIVSIDIESQDIHEDDTP